MVRRRTLLLASALAVLMAVPASAIACTIPVRVIGPFALRAIDIRRPIARETTRAAWSLDETHASAVPRVSQNLKLMNKRTIYGASFRTQRAISLDATGPEDNGWLYFEDNDPNTPPCTMVGKIEWQPPVIRVRESKSEIRVLATSQRTVGDRTGCTLGPDFGVAPCPNLTRIIYRLKQPVGARKIYLETF